MKKLLVIILFTLGLGLLGYAGLEKYTMQAGETKALTEAEEFIDDDIVKKGGGTEPIPLLNGKTPLTTINGEQVYNEQDLAKMLLNRGDVEEYVNAGFGDYTDANGNGSRGGREGTAGAGGAAGSRNGSGSGGTGGANGQNGEPSYNMSNILEYYKKAADNVDFNALKQQRYGQYATGQTIGVLYIPRLDRSLPIIYGTNDNELRYGVGFYKSTKLPGQNDQILLSGHRDTVFRNFGKLQIGDEFHVKMATGTYVYTIFATQIVDANDRTVISPTYPNEVLTVSTCYPFNYLGDAPNRFILYAK